MLYSGLTLMQVFIIAGACVVFLVAVIGFTTCCCMLKAKKRRGAKNKYKENNESENVERSIMYRI